MSDLITRLVPILYVRDLQAERAFYEALGLKVTYEGPEYPDFIALGNEAVEFGISRRDDGEPPERVLTWQLGVSDIDTAAERCRQAGLDAALEVHTPAENWRYRTLSLRSPNGFVVLLEGPSEQ